jgi:hypothetical protein
VTISTQQSQVTLSGNGSTTVFSFPFVAGSASNLVITLLNTSTGVLTTLPASTYNVFLNPISPGQLWAVGGSVTYPTSGSPLATGMLLTIARVLPLQQLVSISNQGDFYPTVVESALDVLELEIQQIAARSGLFRGIWTTATQYNYGDLVIDGANGNNTGGLYTCLIGNLSGTWSTDLANGDWLLAIIQQPLPPTPVGSGVIVSGSSYTAVSTIEYIDVNQSAAPAAFTVNLPAVPALWEKHTVTDFGNTAAVYPITINGNGKFIGGPSVSHGGMTSFPLNFNGQSQGLHYNGQGWALT